MSININDLDTKIYETEKKLRELQEEKARLDNLPENKKLAEQIHEMKCRGNHTDGCSWFYEKDCETGLMDWTRYAHETWLKKANSLLKIAEYDTIIKIAKTL